ncbi:MAG: hypothetical protein AAFR17_06940 [Pseudomonadota bacterium]
MRILVGALLAATVALPASAADFSEGSEAKPWPVQGREKAKFTAKVVDAVCGLSGDCPADCGGGKRQMALLREADGVMLLVGKNLQFQFQGPNYDLAPHCGQVVTVDGLLVGDDPKLAGKIYQVQTIDGEKANGFTGPWKARNPEVADRKGPWFRHDPAINARIDKSGFLGLGLEAEEAFIQEELELAE